MSEYPQFLTKYFRAEDRKYFEEGSLKLGNTAEYRRAESEKLLEARGDELEGTEIIGDPAAVSITSQEFLKLTGAERSDYFEKRRAYHNDVPENFHVYGNTVVSTINAFVFCATEGPYIAKHHDKMRNGDRSTGYLGNPSLTDYCVYDTHRLIQAIIPQLWSHKSFVYEEAGETILYWADVKYNWDRTEATSALDTIFSVQNPSEDKVLKMLTTKRPIFSPEKEFRLLASMKTYVEDSEPPVILKSSGIAAATVEIGKKLDSGEANCNWAPRQ